MRIEVNPSRSSDLIHHHQLHPSSPHQPPTSVSTQPPCSSSNASQSISRNEKEGSPSTLPNTACSSLSARDLERRLKKVWMLIRGRGPFRGYLFPSSPLLSYKAVFSAFLIPPIPPQLSLAPWKKHFRFWIDFQVLSSPKSAELIEQVLIECGGIKTGGPPKLNPVTSAVEKCKDYGYMHLNLWDLLFSITAKAMLAAEVLRPGQVVSIVPGFLCITRKTSLVRSLRATYGDELAFQIAPRTFKLPEELDEWSACMNSQPSSSSRTPLWMLKNNKQRGEGLRLVRAGDEAMGAVFETTHRPGLEGMLLYRWYLAQEYVSNPLLIGGRKSGIRVWVLVPDSPSSGFRVYLHRNGLVLFSDAKYDMELDGDGKQSQSDQRRMLMGHVTNFAQNENGQVWNLDRLKSHLGQQAFKRVWDQIERSVALAFVAALPRVNEVRSQMDLPPRSCFQYFGLDFLLDTNLKPWLLEVNATPSMKVEHEDPVVERMIRGQKLQVVRDIFSMLSISPSRFNQQERDGRDVRDLSLVKEEMERRGGFRPLMHLFPRTPSEARSTIKKRRISDIEQEDIEQADDGRIPWNKLDRMLQGFVKSKEYQAALKL